METSILLFRIGLIWQYYVLLGNNFFLKIVVVCYTTIGLSGRLRTTFTHCKRFAWRRTARCPSTLSPGASSSFSSLSPSALTRSSSFKNTKTKFPLGTAWEEYTADGRTAQTVTTIEGNLIVKVANSNNNQLSNNDQVLIVGRFKPQTQRQATTPRERRGSSPRMAPL